jgi:hypothetical protein
MDIKQEILDNVESKLNNQNALYAALGATLWTIPALIIWFFIYLYTPKMGPVMLLINGFIIGLVVRIHGKGMKPLFSMIAFAVHTWIVVIAFILDIVLFGTTWAILLFGLYAFGAGIAMHIARIEVPFEEHIAYNYLTSMNVHSSSKKLKNRWFITFTLLILTIPISSYLASVGIVFLKEYQFQSNQLQQVNNQKNLLKNLEIELSNEGLNSRKTQQLLRYSYAYHKGLLFNDRGTSSRTFPRSEYKSKRILKYLVKNRDDRRAKFILSRLIGGSQGNILLQEAAEQGDRYARVYSLIELGCYSDAELATRQLNKLRKLFHEKYIQEEIDSILYIGFSAICSDLEEPEFQLSYFLNYKEN